MNSFINTESGKVELVFILVTAGIEKVDFSTKIEIGELRGLLKVEHERFSNAIRDAEQVVSNDERERYPHWELVNIRRGEREGTEAKKQGKEVEIEEIFLLIQD